MSREAASFFHYREQEYRVTQAIGEFEEIIGQEGIKEASYNLIEIEWEHALKHYLVVENKLCVAKGLFVGGDLTLKNWKARRFLPFTGNFIIAIDGDKKWYENKWKLFFIQGELVASEDLDPDLALPEPNDPPIKYFASS